MRAKINWVSKIFLKFIEQRVAISYIASGLSQTIASLIIGIIILRWLAPEILGEWQSITVFTGYAMFLTLGITNAINRELPYYLGKGDNELAMKKISTAGFYISKLSAFLFFTSIVITLILLLLNTLTLRSFYMINMAVAISSINILSNQLGATYRTSKSFNKLAVLQWFSILVALFAIPLVLFYNIHGFIIYNFLSGTFLYLGLRLYRPFKIKYSFNRKEFMNLLKIGFPMYSLNYISLFTQSFPRLFLVLFGTPFLVGLFSLGASLYSSMSQLPVYINRYVFPRMTYEFGKTGNKSKLFNTAFDLSVKLGIIMLAISIMVASSLPYLIKSFFPKYLDGILAAQIVLFFGVFNSMSGVLQNSLNSLIAIKELALAISSKVVFYSISIVSFYLFSKNLLLAAASGMVIGEFLSYITLLILLRKLAKMV